MDQACVTELGRREGPGGTQPGKVPVTPGMESTGQSRGVSAF